MIDTVIDEGVVKYSLEFTEDKHAVSFEDIKELEECRKRLYKLELIGAYPDGIGFGNISQLSQNGGFFITSTQTGHLANLDKNLYSKVESVDIKAFTTYAKGSTKPSSEAITHEAIYRLDNSIKAIIHIHNEKLWRYMIDNGYKTSADVPYGSPQMVESVIEIYQNKEDLRENIFAMRGHFEGVFAFGKTLKEAEDALLGLYDLVNK
ncbi:MAG: class II aldolase/adducin family protein [Sulfurovum sp.]